MGTGLGCAHTRGAMVVRLGEGETKSVSFLLPIIGRGGDRQ